RATTPSSPLPLHAALPISAILADHLDLFLAGLNHRAQRRQVSTLRKIEPKEDILALVLDVRVEVRQQRLDYLPRHPGHIRIRPQDRKSTRLNSSHVKISYA